MKRFAVLLVAVLLASLLTPPASATSVAQSLPMGSLAVSQAQLSAYVPGARNVWNDGSSPYSVGMWDDRNHYFLVRPGVRSDDAHGPWTSEYISIRTVFFGPGSCARWYKWDWTSNGTPYWRYLWRVYAGETIPAYHWINGQPTGSYLYVFGVLYPGGGCSV
jgi:hypothetical protein